MANKRDLKKDINYVLGDIIESVYIWEYTNTDKNSKKGEAIIDEAIETFDDLMERVNKRGLDDAKAHFKAINNDLETKARSLVDKINKLG
ncbi:hypothetical protein [Mangrovimonas spongiae]|uniref:Uncharacterized protein n=1 Tax=Mangrovimonas spongiae TaxID=2494697 RepID=A0A428JYH6_9FLAO|nr:hypothetical protein [Mangrovimonas spongiae]RSK39210.1 hypothetical protein EJA19_09745 [Mangrovimonas spongiae]